MSRRPPGLAMIYPVQTKPYEASDLPSGRIGDVWVMYESYTDEAAIRTENLWLLEGCFGISENAYSATGHLALHRNLPLPYTKGHRNCHECPITFHGCG